MESSAHHILWERRQAELWERLFQLAQDVTTLADKFGATAGSSVAKQELVKSCMNVGKYVVRGTAAQSEKGFIQNIEEARMQAIEADYWLRLAYVVEQKEALQRDISGSITQIASIIELLKKMAQHVEEQHDRKEHARVAKVSL